MTQTPTAYLGQFTDDNAERIGVLLDEAGIEWWAKSPARVARFVFAGEWGTRLFVDEERHADAVAIAEKATGQAPQ